MSEFKEAPVLILETMEDVRTAMAAAEEVKEFGQKTARFPGYSGTEQYRIKSLWIIGLIDELAVNGFVYNSDVKKLAEQRLGLPPKPEAEYSKEGDTLSLLVYNGQSYRRSDQMIAAGFKPLTDAMLQEAFCSGKRIQTVPQILFNVRRVGEKLYAMLPRKRKSALSTGTPARIVD